MKSSTVALISSTIVATAGIGYYYYSQRKKSSQVPQDGIDKLRLIEKVITASSNEVYPQTPEEKEKYFMEKISAGESLCLNGPEYYNDAVLHFYKALKVYPVPQELILIYQNTIPAPVFQYITSILMIEQKAMENQQSDSPEFAAAAATGYWH